MALMSPSDSMFLIPETRDQPMHVGSLQLFARPDGADSDFMPDLFQRMLAVDEVAPLFRKRAHRSLATLGQWAWQDDRGIDLEHHVRHSALPRPGRIRELLALASRLHSTLLDRHRPLWEVHLIEGLEDGRFAVYTKMHHALMDGVSALALLSKASAHSPDDLELRAPYLPVEPTERSGEDAGGGGLAGLPGAAAGAIGDVLGLGPTMLRLAERTIRDQVAGQSGGAPRTIFNGGITGSRRFAAQSWPLERMRAVADAASLSLNDIVLAMCAGALRDYLIDLDALPDDPLTAMVPVSLRGLGLDTSAGNAVGIIIANLATDEADPARRMAAIGQSMQQGKDMLDGMSVLQVTAMSAVSMAPLALGSVLGIGRLLPLPFNLVISNVPGPREPLWFNGARLDAIYPMSIPVDGQALNITVTSYVDNMEFGVMGCRRSVPHLQRLLGHLDTALSGLERAVG
jgi:diacylglycerol O-acyltransferase / wax synthase